MVLLRVRYCRYVSRSSQHRSTTHENINTMCSLSGLEAESRLGRLRIVVLDITKLRLVLWLQREGRRWVAEAARLSLTSRQLNCPASVHPTHAHVWSSALPIFLSAMAEDQKRLQSLSDALQKIQDGMSPITRSRPRAMLTSS